MLQRRAADEAGEPYTSILTNILPAAHEPLGRPGHDFGLPTVEEEPDVPMEPAQPEGGGATAPASSGPVQPDEPMEPEESGSLP